ILIESGFLVQTSDGRFRQAEEINEGRRGQYGGGKGKPKDAKDTGVPPLGTIDDLKLSLRTHNFLKNRGIDTLEKLVVLTEGQARTIKGIGRVSLREIKEALARQGMHFNDNVIGVNNIVIGVRPLLHSAPVEP